MKILLTGGAGFIGSHIAQEYINRGHEVAIIDNLSNGKKENIPRNAEFFEANTQSTKELKRIFEITKPDILNHQAAQINIQKSVTFPEFDAKANINAGIKLMEIAKKNQIKKMIFASSGGAIYGETEKRGASERTVPNPLSPYGVSKLSFEHYLQYYNAVYNIPYVILRYASVYGPGQNEKGEGGIIYTLLKKVLQKKTLYIKGDGEQKRDFVFVEDVAKANILVTDPKKLITRSRLISDQQIKSDTYNLGSQKETSINDVLSLIQSKFPKQKIYVRHKKPIAGDIQNSTLTSTKISKTFNWQEKTSLSTGIRKTLWHMQNREKI